MYLQLKTLKPTNNNYYLVPFLQCPVKYRLRLIGNDTSYIYYTTIVYYIGNTFLFKMLIRSLDVH